MLLLEPYMLGRLELRNRVVMAPMCMYEAGGDGKATDFHLAHYAGRALVGVGLIIVEATAVRPEGRITDNDLGLWDDAQIEGMRRVVDACHRFGTKVAVQLAHAGRKSTCDGLVKFAPTAQDFNPGEYPVPTTMSEADVETAVSAFGSAAARAEAAGFDAIEIHGAHGYLIHEFLSPLSNQREDQWGGSKGKRLRFLAQVIRSIRSNWPEGKPVGVRFSATDWIPGGLIPEDIAQSISQLLATPGTEIDFAHISTGGLVPVADPPPVFPGYQLPMAEQVHELTDKSIPVITVGLYSDSGQMEEIIQHDRSDLIALGRELLRNPNWVLAEAHAAGQDELIPEAWKRGYKY